MALKDLISPMPSSETDEKGEEEGVATDGNPSITEAAGSSSEIPRGIQEVVTPSGISIYFQAAPKRLYKVNGKEVPSVTTVLDVLERGGLSWWGMCVGVEGVQALAAAGIIKEQWFYLPPEVIVNHLRTYSLTVNDTLTKAGVRGDSVHKALEGWVETGNLPEPVVFVPEERGYVEGLRKFLVDSGAEAIASEVMVASKKHKFAGRYDLDAKVLDGAEVFVHVTPKGRGDRKERIDGGLWRIDLKTSGSVYPNYHMQVEAYEDGAQECGYGASDHRGVLRVTADGRYELKASKATFTDFKAVLSAYRALERVKAR